jgi:FeS assembly SUF system protein
MNRLARFAGYGAKHDDEAAAPPPTPVEHAPAFDSESLRQPIIDALRTVHDPEIPVNIYDLGLIYTIDIAQNADIHIDMTLTAPACPVAGMMPVMVKDAVQRVDGVGDVQVELVWDPPWSQDKMSEEALLALGML